MYFNIKTGILVLFVVVEFSSGLPYNNKKSTDEESDVIEDSRLLTRLRRSPDDDPQSEALIETRFGRGWQNNHHGYNHVVGQNYPNFGYGPPKYHPHHQPWYPHGHPHYPGGSHPHGCNHNNGNGRPSPTQTPPENSSENPGVSPTVESSTLPQIDIRVGRD
ncbi:protein pygopus-like isoform X2 [Diabrotica virgifera virgifera]|uniref:Protein pygopus-like isoform X2 n=1 Tax=Diabrotica virgifera virgifera TaxID=50390 RepID=A0A6P7GHF0_DIAVI|nr:protein pygopus-like isoform X2 [Diabrotica virgifera virgifera]